MKIVKLAVFLAQATSLFGAYQYYQSDTFSSFNSANWWVIGNAVATAQGLSAQGDAAVISTVPIPDGSWDYEVKITLALADNSQGDLLPVIYLRDQGNPLDNNAFWYYSVEFDASSSTGTCSYSVYRHRTDSSGVTNYLIAQGGGACHNGSTIRSIVYISPPNVDAFFGIYIDDQLVGSIIDASGFPYGVPGVGIKSGCLSGCGGTISRVDIGLKDRISPNAVSQATIGTSVWANRMDAQWQPAVDDANGIGVSIYGISRNGTFIAWPGTPSYSDATLLPGTSYLYTVYAIDFHGNWSAGASFNVTTPGNHPNPAIAIPPMRNGVRPTGAYWGSGGEQLDTLSGNLNFTLPLLTVQSRGGRKVGLGLSYNSQMWRQDSGGTWGYGADVGFGFGWRLMVGSIAAYWSDPYTIDHYVFTDSSGADYALRVNTNGIWTSTEGIYISYDPNGQKLSFPDGSVWTMGCVSGGSEPDIGWQYPTTLQDSNGNLIIIRYQPGVGVGYLNSSARIWEVEDVRAVYSSVNDYHIIPTCSAIIQTQFHT